MIKEPDMVEVSHIRKKYGKKVVLEDINFSISPGQCIAIVGKNGCGKSTLLFRRSLTIEGKMLH